MQNQKGASLIIAIIMLTVITLVAVYALENSNIQSKMVGHSLFIVKAFQECRSEQEGQVRYYNETGGSNRETLLTIAGLPYSALGVAPTLSAADTVMVSDPSNIASNMSIEWRYIKDAPSRRTGYEIDVESPIKTYLYEQDCDATLRFTQSSQTQGALVEGLKATGNIK